MGMSFAYGPADEGESLQVLHRYVELGGNFLDTAGHLCGTMILRWTRAQSRPIPTCRVEKLANLRLSKQALPE